MLVALAAQMPRSVLFHQQPSPSGRGQGEGALAAPRHEFPYPVASSAMAAGPLRLRIRRILQLEDDPMLVSGKSLALMLAGVLIAATLTLLYLPTTGQAEQPATDATADAAKADKDLNVADALDEFRKALVTYDIDFD